MEKIRTMQKQDTKRIRERLANLLQKNDLVALEVFLEGLHPSDIADVIEALDRKTGVKLLRTLPSVLASETLTEVEEGQVRSSLFSSLDPEEAADFLEKLSDDDAADLLGELTASRQDKILAEMSNQEAIEIKDLLKYEEDTAGSIMTTSLVSVFGTVTAGEAIEVVRKKGREVEGFYTVFVVDNQNTLLGTVPLDNLLLAEVNESVKNLVEPIVASVLPNSDQEDVGRLISRYNLVSIPVVTNEGILLGRITFDDVIDVIESETTEDLFLFSGLSDDEDIKGGPLETVQARLPWLFLNTMTASLAATVVWWFRDEIASATLLAVVMPVVAGLGGNAGQQALAVTVRSLATGSGPLETKEPRVRKELMVAFVNGAAVALVVSAAASILAIGMGVSVRLGVVVLLAMWGNIAMAGFAGSFIPTFLEKQGYDPAVASTVFLTALTDLTGFLLLLGIADLML